MDYSCEKQPLKVHNESPGSVEFVSELSKGRFSVTANVCHAGGKATTCKVFDKSTPEGEEASKREMKNLKTLRHERLVSRNMFLIQWNILVGSMYTESKDISRKA